MADKESSKTAILEMVAKMDADQLIILKSYAHGLIDMKARLKKGE